MTAEQNKKQASNWSLSFSLIDRYVSKEFLVSYLIALSVLLSLVILIDLFVMFDEFVETESDAKSPGVFEVVAKIFDYYGPKVFQYFRDLSGMIVLLAAAFSLARMTRQNELTAVLASGISLKRVIAPIIFLGFLLNMLLVVDQEFILPRLADKLVRRHDESSARRTVRVWNLPDREKALLSGRYDPEKKVLSKLYVILRKEGRLTGLITADRAERWNPKEKSWRLINGLCFRFGNAEEAGAGDSMDPCASYRSDLSPEYLWLQRNSSYKSLMSSKELSRLLDRDLKRGEYAEIISEKHFRFADPIINMVMLLLGLPMLVSREKRSTKTSIFLAIMGSGGCFLATFACKLLAGGMMPPLLAAGLPIVIFLPLSVVILDGLKT